MFNNTWQLVALHHAGVAQADGTALNEGIRISAIVDHLLSSEDEAARGSEAFNELLETLDPDRALLGPDDILQTTPGDNGQRIYHIRLPNGTAGIKLELEGAVIEVAPN